MDCLTGNKGPRELMFAGAKEQTKVQEECLVGIERAAGQVSYQILPELVKMGRIVLAQGSLNSCTSFMVAITTRS
jgi:hypothetical protein